MAGQDCAGCGGSLHRPSSIEVDGQRYHESCAPVSRDHLSSRITELEAALKFIAGHVMSDEGDRDQTENDIGLDFAEVVEMAHDNMIQRARTALNV